MTQPDAFTVELCGHVCSRCGSCLDHCCTCSLSSEADLLSDMDKTGTEILEAQLGIRITESHHDPA